MYMYVYILHAGELKACMFYRGAKNKFFFLECYLISNLVHSSWPLVPVFWAADFKISNYKLTVPSTLEIYLTAELSTLLVHVCWHWNLASIKRF